MTNHPNRNWRRHMSDRAGALGDNLVEAWITIKSADGATLESIAAELGERCDRVLNGNLLARWRRGAQSTPKRVERAMRRDVLAYLLENDHAADAIVAVLEPPDTR